MECLKSVGVSDTRVELSIQEKLELINKLESGASVNMVCKEYGVKRQTVSDIRKTKDKLRKFAVDFKVENGSSIDIKKTKHMIMAKKKVFDRAVYKWLTQQQAANIPVRGVELAAAAKKVAKHMNVEFKASNGWLWRFKKRHGLTNRKLSGDTNTASRTEIDSFRSELLDLIRKEKLHTSELYNADETGLLWKSLPRNLQVNNAPNIERLSVLCCSNADGTHRLPLAIVGKSIHPNTFPNSLVHYYHSKNAWFTTEIFCEWFFNYFIPAVRQHQQQILNKQPENIRALLLLDIGPVHPIADSLVSEDGKFRVMFFPFNTPSIIQPMDQGVLVECKRLYQKRFLDEVFVVLEKENQVKNTQRQRLLVNIKNYNITSAIYNLAASWNDIKMSTLSDSWKILLLNTNYEQYLDRLQAADFLHCFQRAGETLINLENVEEWLKENDDHLGYQQLSIDEIAQEVIKADANQQVDDDDDANTPSPPQPSLVRSYLDRVITYVDLSTNLEMQLHYQSLRRLRELVIKEQFNDDTQRELDTIFKPPTATSPSLYGSSSLLNTAGPSTSSVSDVLCEIEVNSFDSEEQFSY